jgi:vacuolar-type H+-ATPase subunit H
MAFKLTSKEDARKSDLEAELEQAVGAVEDARNELQEEIAKLIADFNEKHVDPLNAKLEEAHGFVEDIVNERQGEYDDKSERWQEGDRGQSAQSWLQDWETGMNELEAMEQVEVPEVYITIPDAHNALAGLPFEMDQ